jgi:hypothetical protein
MSDIVRCPYCVEGNNFKAMMGSADGQRFMCGRCSHVTVPANPDYQCTCLNCTVSNPREQGAEKI